MILNLKPFNAVAQTTRAPAAINLLFLCVVAAATFAFNATAQTASLSPVGLWRSIDDKTGQPKAEIRIAANTAGVLTGVVEKALITPPELTCTLCADDRKDKPKLGMEVIRGAAKADGKDTWEGGKVLDPENGKNYTLRLTLVESGSKLEVRGSIGPFGRTQTWIRIQ